MVNLKLKPGFKVPESWMDWLTIGLGCLTVLLFSTQYLFDWYGANAFDKTFYSLLVLFVAATSVGFVVSTNLLGKTDDALQKALMIAMVIVIAVILLIMSLNGGLMMMDSNYASFVNTEGRGGYFYGIRFLSNQITQSDIGQLQLFSEGIAELVRALFLIVPGLIGTWGGLSVLTAQNMGEATGGIFAILAAMVVFFIVWIFKAINVTLMPAMLVFWLFV